MNWVQRAVHAVGEIGGGDFPNDRIRIDIQPMAGADRPVVFGLLKRGRPASIQILIDENATLEELKRDWVLVHELSHLWLPRLRDDDKWLTEGVATYLQEVLRARAGIQTAEEAWRNLRSGFARGENAGTGRTLIKESRMMQRTGAYHRVYWAGASFALQADVHLRRQGSSLLDAVVLSRQRIDAGEKYPNDAIELLSSWESVTGTSGLLSIARRAQSARTFKTPERLLKKILAPPTSSMASQIMSRR